MNDAQFNAIKNHLPEVLARLAESLTHVNYKFMQRIVDALINAQSLSLNKAEFIAQVTPLDGEISADNFRARIKAINAALKKLDLGLSLTSAKTALNLNMDTDTLQKLTQAQVLIQLKSHSNAEAIDESRFVPAMASPTRNPPMLRQVMFSYAWDMNPQQLALQQAFATRLKNALATPPATYKNSPKVSLFWDVSDFKIGEGQKQQQNAACAATPIVVIIYTDKYIYSTACRAEANYFLDDDGNNRPGRMGIVVPFSTTFGEMDARYQTNLAATPKQNTVMALLESAIESEINTFIKALVKCIYKWFESHPTPLQEDEYAKQHKIPFELTRNPQIEIDPAKHEATHAKSEASAEAVNIVEHMRAWGLSKDPKTERLFYLLGDFGAGKSTVCQLLTKAMMHEYENSSAEAADKVLPIYLDLKKLLNAFNPQKTHVDAPIAVLLEEMLRKAGVNDIKGEEVIRYIQHYPCLVIFDGFDEIGQKLTEQQQVGLLNKMLGVLPDAVYSEDLKRLAAKGSFQDTNQHRMPLRTRIVITCRTHFFESAHKEQAFKRAYYRSDAGQQQGIIKNYQNYYLLPFTKAQIKSYLINWLGDAAGKRAAQFIETVHDLSGLSEKPIMLRLIKDLIPELELKAQQSQHINAATLYNTLFQQIGQRDVDKHLIQLDEKQRLLSHFALYLWQQRTTDLNRLVLQDWFMQFKVQLPMLSNDINTGKYSIDLLLQDLHNASLLVRDDDDNFRFAHSSFYEYFLACGIFETVRLTELTPGQSFDVLTKQIEGLALSPETVQFLLDWRLTTNTQYRQTFDQHWRWLQQQDCQTEAKALTFQIWLTAYQSGQDFPLPVKPNWRGMRFEGIKLAARTGQVIDWSGAKLASCKMVQCDFKGVRFAAADFSLADIRLSYFEHCDFSGINTSDSTWHRNRFWYCQGSDDWQQRLQTIASPLARNFVMPNPNIKQELHKKTGCHLKLQLNIGQQNALAYSPDGSHIVSGGVDGKVRLWDAVSGNCLVEWGGDGMVRSVAFSPDGSFILSGGKDGKIRLWDVVSGDSLAEWVGKGGPINAVALSPDGSYILSGGADGKVRLWDTKSGICLAELAGNHRLVNSVAFSPDGSRIASGGIGKVRIWDTSSGNCLAELAGDYRSVNSVAFSPDGSRIFSGGDNGKLHLWDAGSGDRLAELAGDGFSINSVAFSPDGSRIFSGDDNGKVCLWDAFNGNCLAVWAGNGMVRSVVVSPDGSHIASCGIDGKIHLRDARSGDRLAKWAEYGRSVNAVAFSQDGNRIFSGGDNGKVCLWDAFSGIRLAEWAGDGGSVYAVAVSSDGNRIISGGADGKVRIWDARTGDCLAEWAQNGGQVRSVAISPDGSRIVTGGNDGMVRLWNAGNGDRLAEWAGDHIWVMSLAVSPDGSRIVSAGLDGNVRLWDAGSGERLAEWLGDGGPLISVAVSPDGSRIVSGGADGELLWDAGNGDRLAEWAGDGRSVNAVAFSSDGSRFFSAGLDGKVCLWDIDSGDRLAEWTGEGGHVNTVAVSPDGQAIIIGGVWGLTHLKLNATLQKSWTSAIFSAGSATLDANLQPIGLQGDAWKYLTAERINADGSVEVVAPTESPDWEKIYRP